MLLTLFWCSTGEIDKFELQAVQIQAANAALAPLCDENEKRVRSIYASYPFLVLHRGIEP